MQTLLRPSDTKSGICRRMAPLRVLYIVTLAYFQGQFEMWKSRKRWEQVKMLVYVFYKGWYLPANGEIANVVLHDLYLNFQGQTFQVTVLTIKQILLLASDRKSGICHRMAPLWMLYIMTWTYIVKVKNFKTWISRKRWLLAKSAQLWLLLRSMFAIEWDHCECCTPWHWPKFSRSNIFLQCLYEKKSRRQRMSPADLPRLERSQP